MSDPTKTHARGQDKVPTSEPAATTGSADTIVFTDTLERECGRHGRACFVSTAAHPDDLTDADYLVAIRYHILKGIASGEYGTEADAVGRLFARLKLVD